MIIVKILAFPIVFFFSFIFAKMIKEQDFQHRETEAKGYWFWWRKIIKSFWKKYEKKI